MLATINDLPLLPYLREFSDKIAAVAGTAIRLERREPDKTNVNPNALAYRIGASPDFTPWIIYRNSQEIPNHMILHELLHLRRVVVQGIPQLVTLKNGADYPEDGHCLENAIEHTVIVPVQLKCGIESKKYWNDLVVKLLKKSRGNIPDDPQDRRRMAVIASLDARYCVTDLRVKKAVAKWIAKLGETKFAHEFIQRYRRAHGNKAEMARMVLRAIGEKRLVGLRKYGKKSIPLDY